MTTQAAQQIKIKKRLFLLRAKISKCEEEIAQLQVTCTHPDVVVTNHSDTGNYCKADDEYWQEYKCPDCCKFWNTRK